MSFKQTATSSLPVVTTAGRSLTARKPVLLRAQANTESGGTTITPVIEAMGSTEAHG